MILAMKVLLTNSTLATRTGTEIVTRDLALGLVRAGHEACVFTPFPGDVASEILAAGVPVVSRLEDVPFRPDIIHGHHHVETTLALVHFQSVPAIFVCHDRLNWHDAPPRLEAVRFYVAVDRNCLERLVLEAGIPLQRTCVILNAVDMRRFTPRPPLPGKPTRALVFSNYATEGAELEMLRQVCREAGLELAVAGRGVGAQADRPEHLLGDFDLVFAKGRCALEALAAGCAVILCDLQGLGPMITSAQLQELREWNLGMRCLQRRLTPEAVGREIAQYDRVDAARVTKLVRAGASLDRAVSDYVKLYRRARAESDGSCVRLGEPLEALARDVGSLQSALRVVGEPFAMPPLPRQAVAQIGIRVLNPARSMAPGESAQVSVEVDNRSSEVLASMPPYPVHVSYHWLKAGTRRRLVFDGQRTPLSAAVRPRSRHSQEARVLAPDQPGRYLLVLTLVQEHQFWFDQTPQAVAAECEVTVIEGEGGSPHERALAEVVAWTSVQVVRDGR